MSRFPLAALSLWEIRLTLSILLLLRSSSALSMGMSTLTKWKRQMPWHYIDRPSWIHWIESRKSFAKFSVPNSFWSCEFRHLISSSSDNTSSVIQIYLPRVENFILWFSANSLAETDSREENYCELQFEWITGEREEEEVELVQCGRLVVDPPTLYY